MKLISCHIENFGKLSDCTFDFSEGLNAFLEKNGFGKSTLLTFLKVMFYGFDNEEKRSEKEREREKYRPWQGGIYGGQVTFESNGKIYQAVRVFDTKKNDRFELTDMSTKLKSEDFSSQIGRELFGIDAEAFKRSVFIGQNDCRTYATDGINAGMDMGDGSDLNTYSKATESLDRILNSLSPDRKTGKLNELKRTIENDGTSLMQMDTVIKSLEELKNRIDEADGKIYELELKKQELVKVLDKSVNQSKVKNKTDIYRTICKKADDQRVKKEELEKFFVKGIPTIEEVSHYVEICGTVEGNRSLMEEQRQNEERSINAELAENRDIQSEWEKTKLKKERIKETELDLAREQAAERQKSDKIKKHFIISMVVFVLGVLFILFDAYFGKNFGDIRKVFIPGKLLVIPGAVYVIGVYIYYKSCKQTRACAQFKELIFQLNTAINISTERVKAYIEKNGIAYNETMVDINLKEIEEKKLQNLRLFGKAEEVRNIARMNEALEYTDFMFDEPAEGESRFAKSAKRYNDSKSAVETFMNKYGFETGENMRATLSDVLLRIKEIMTISDEIEKTEQEAREYALMNNINALSGEEMEYVNVEEKNETLSKTENEKSEIEKNRKEYVKQSELQNERLEELYRIEAEREAAKQEYEEKERFYKMVRNARDMLTEAKEKYTMQYADKSGQYFEEFIGSVLEGEDENLVCTFDANSNVRFKEHGMFHEADGLSAGYQDLVGICQRLSFAKAIFGENKPFIVFDDSFANLDNDKLEGAKKLLHKTALEYQVLYFTCSKERSME